ncbi:Oidioi.mRNA.OKI2018_I69.XSR.g13887.t1.cds [Oikopleura dioica]|uniref:Oidioi.mRNA.OKI2018_I69.XSR.g13887.t1.cds n=1 Tax=Oikopleura dioica TaxID=34765 RepID=A0ABN7SGT3_OIKDI|nr:Oidioi.mRNA.OKI2018_I69.XSR.g13887.t1.cds [Oikopleura dioica]
MDDISTEELSDISQDNTDSQKDLLSPSKREGELLSQIADLEDKLELLEQETLPELMKDFLVEKSPKIPSKNINIPASEGKCEGVWPFEWSGFFEGQKTCPCGPCVLAEAIYQAQAREKRLQYCGIDEKWKKIESKAAADKRTLHAYKEYLRDSATAESKQEMNEADAELESKREEFRNQLLQEYEEKQRLMLEEKAQMDSCPNWIEMYENKNKRRLRPRDAKDDKPDDPLSISIQNSGLKWLRKKAKLYYPELDPKRKRVGHSATLLTESEILLTEAEIAEDLKLIKTSRKRRDNAAPAQKKDVQVINGKLKIGLKYFFKNEVVVLFQRESNSRETVKITSITDKELNYKRPNGQIGRISLGKLARDKFKLSKSQELHSSQ